MKRKHCRGSDKGFTLLELIVVMAIIAIITTMAALSMSYVNNANASKAANTLDSMIDTARAQSISKGTEAGKLTLFMDAKGRLWGEIGDDGYPDTHGEMICTNRIKVYVNTGTSAGCYTLGPTSSTPMAPGETYVIGFLPSGVVKDSAMMSPSSANVSKVFFEGGRRMAEVILYRETGKHKTDIRYN